MKTLYLWRHAKSDWGSMDLDDHDRVLAPRGTRDAPRVAAAMKDRDFVPAQIFCSSARRTIQTLKLFQQVMGDEIPHKIDRGLYLAAPETLLARIRGASDDKQSLLILAHNPGLEMLSAELSAQGDTQTPNFPTAAFAAFEFDVDHWKEIETRTGRLLEFMTPKSLAA